MTVFFGKRILWCETMIWADYSNQTVDLTFFMQFSFRETVSKNGLKIWVAEVLCRFTQDDDQKKNPGDLRM